MNKIIIFIFFNISLFLNIFSQSNHIKPEIKIIDNKIQVYWKTSSLTGKSIVLFSPDDKISNLPFPDYYERSRDANIDSAHSLVLENIKDNIVYNFRVSCFSKANLNELRSLNYKFKVIRKNNSRILGLVITEGPIISQITKNSAIISWKTNFPSSGEVLLSKKEDPKSIKVKEVQYDSERFEIKIKDLTADHGYNYRIRSYKDNDTIESSLYSFSAAPENFRPFSFAVLSDSRSGGELDFDHRLNGVNFLTLNSLIKDIGQKKVSLVLFAGDLIGGVCSNREEVELQYKTWKQAVSEVNSEIPIYACMGNHDALGYQIPKNGGLYDPPGNNSNEEIWKQEFSLPENSPENESGYPTYRENVYSFDFSDVHFVTLNSDYYSCTNQNRKIIDDPYSVKIDRRQRKWLRDDLENNSNKKIIVYFHSPAYPAGGHVGSALDRSPEIRDSVWSILDKYNVRLVFNGHEHNYSRTRVDPTINKKYNHTIYQVVSGRAGAPSYAQDMKNPFVANVVTYSRKNNYVIVNVEKDFLIVKSYDDQNNIIDEFKVR